MSGFRRLVLELGRGTADPVMLRQAAAFAQLLDIELHALFVEDETLLHASALPFTREINPLSLRWRNFEPDRLQAEMRAAAEQARRHLNAVANATGVRRHFEVRRGDLTLSVTETCAAGDIVVVAAPRRETTHGFDRLRETAHRSLASVLFLPPASPKQGLIAAVVTGADDPSLALARQIAAQGRERLLVLAPAGTEIDGNVRVITGTTVQDIIAAMGDTRERLIVLTRDGDHGSGPELASGRGVAVLVVEP
jgi:hypothetical protein